MREYLDLVKTILKNGERRPNRTGIDTISCFGIHYKINLAKGFPLLTTKKVFFNSVLYELLWYLSGQTHIRDLRKHTKIWDAWSSADKNWKVGNMYGYQWTKWEQYLEDPQTCHIKLKRINQIQKIIQLIKTTPFDRRMVVSAWNPADIYRQDGDPKKPVLPPCHIIFMFYVSKDKRLNCHLTQRSADLMLGVPFNLACYAVLTQMIAQECGLNLGEFSHYMNDCHIYINHIQGAKEQLQRKPLKRPFLKIASKPFWKLKFKDFKLINYQHHPSIPFKVAV